MIHLNDFIQSKQIKRLQKGVNSFIYNEMQSRNFGNLKLIQNSKRVFYMSMFRCKNCRHVQLFKILQIYTFRMFEIFIKISTYIKG